MGSQVGLGFTSVVAGCGQQGRAGIFLMGSLGTELTAEQMGRALGSQDLMQMSGAWEPNGLSSQLANPTLLLLPSWAVPALPLGLVPLPGKLLYLLPDQEHLESFCLRL